MAKWLNTKTIVNEDIEKPCVKLHYCPYGQLVEEYPLYQADDYPHKQLGDKLACLEKNGALTQFGHDCPVHYHMEYLYYDTKNKKGIIPE